MQHWPFRPRHVPSTLLMFSYSNLYLTFYKELCMVLITTKALKSGLKLRLKRFKNQKISFPGKGDALSPGPLPNSLGSSGLSKYQVHYKCLLILNFIVLSLVLIATKAFKSGLRMHLERFKIKNFLPRERGHSFPWTPYPQPWPFGPRHIPCTPLMLLILTFYLELCMVLITTKELKSV